MEKPKEITKDMKIQDIIDLCPEAAEIMLNYGLYCVGCPIASQESLEHGALSHGISKERLAKMLKEINKAYQKRISEE